MEDPENRSDNTSLGDPDTERTADESSEFDSGVDEAAGTDAEATSGTAARERLYDIMRQDVSFEQRAHEALELGRQFLDVGNAHLTQIDAETGHWEAVASTDPHDGQFPPGLRLDLEETYCRRTVASGSSIALHDAEQQGWGDDPAFEEHGLSCYHGTPLFVEGRPYGTVCFVATAARREAFTDTETMFAKLVAQQLERAIERERHEVELTRRNNLVNVLNRVLRHNLRNDMTVVRGRTRMIGDSLPGDTNVGIVLRKIDGIIELCEKAGAIEDIVGEESTRRATDVDDLVRRVTETVGRQFPSASITVAGDTDVVTGTLPSLERALRELIENAAKHSGDEPAVEVTVEAAPDLVEITIADDGPGLTEQEQRVLRNETDRPLEHGSGLGLWLVHWIVTGHDGTVEPAATDAGTTMTVTIPRSMQEVTQQVEQLRMGRNLYQAVFEDASDAILIVDDDASIVRANSEAATLYGVERDDLRGHSLREFVPPGYDFETTWEAFHEADGGRDTEVVHRADSTERVVEYSGRSDIVPGYHLFISRDVTERERREASLQEASSRLRGVVAASPDAILALDTDGVVELWNEAATELFGYTATEAVGNSLQSLDLHSTQQATAFADRFERALDGEVFTDLVVERETADGERVSLSISTAPLRDETESITGVVAVAKRIEDDGHPDTA